MSLDRDEIGPHIESLACQAMGDPGRVGLAVGVIAGDEEWQLGCGRIDRDRPGRPDGDTIFQIGSITKVFTALALADLVGEGVLALHSPVHTCLAPAARPRPSRARNITLFELATHTSGLPRLPHRIRWLALKEPENPYASFSVEDLHAALSRTWLGWPRARRFRYSNFGGGLLGHALTTHSGLTYEQLVTERICRPLGLEDTLVVVPPGKRGRAAQGHGSGGEPVPDWELPALPGAGALRSTINDLLRFLRANLDPPDSRLGRAIELCQAPQVTVSKTMAAGLGWQIWSLSQAPGPMVWHNGGTGGFFSFLGFVSQSRTAVVVLSNSAVSVDPVGTRLLETLSTRKAPTRSA